MSAERGVGAASRLERVIRFEAGKLTQGTFERALSGEPLPEATPVLVDLTDVTFADPAGAVMLALLLRYYCDNGGRVSCRLPREPAVTGYLARMHLLDAFSSKIAFSETPSGVARRSWPDNSFLIELNEIRAEADVVGFARRANRLLRDSLGMPRDRASALAQIMTELCSNIAEHSEGVGYVMAQSYRKATGRRFTVVALGDAGIGMAESLRRAGLLAPDADDVLAIDLALREGVSRFGQPGRGGGLPNVLRHVSQLGGSIRIRSGAGGVMIRGSRRDGRVAWFPGTQIRVSLSEVEQLTTEPEVVF